MENLKFGYSTIDIRTPKEVTYEEGKQTEKEFHAVEFMRQVRSEQTEEYLQDKQKYFDHLKKAMEDFKLRQTKAFSQ